MQLRALMRPPLCRKIHMNWIAGEGFVNHTVFPGCLPLTRSDGKHTVVSQCAP